MSHVTCIRRKGRSTAAACAVLLVVGACTTLRPSETVDQADARAAIALSALEREHLRAGMRLYLDSVQGIVDATSEGKWPRAAAAARKSGMGSVDGVPLATVAKLPPEFTLLSLETHRKFDALAETAAAPGATHGAVMAALRDILANCSACHASYKLGDP